MKFRSKVDWWLAGLVASAIVFPVVAGIRLLLAGSSDGEVRTLLGSAAFAVLLIVAVAVPVHYTLAQDELVIRSGLVKKRIPYHRILSTRETHSAWSSPAWSLDRIELTLDGFEQVLISPVRKEEFLARLKQRVDTAQGHAIRND
jgi:hypothetical protein